VNSRHLGIFLCALIVLTSLRLDLFGASVDKEVSIQNTTVQGVLHCLYSGGSTHPAKSEHDCEMDGGRYVLITSQGVMHLFDPSDQRALIFREPRVRDKILRVHGQLSDNGLTIVNLYSISDGVPYRMYYRCEVCNITAYAPGPCWCCQEDFEFRETPVTDYDALHPERNP
jgi:hypothetical protein